MKNVNYAVEIRNRALLNSAFTEAASLLREVQQEGLKTANIVRRVELEEKLRHLLWIYRRRVKDIANKRRKLENPIGKQGHLKKATLKQYHSVIKGWPEEQRALKTEIQELNRAINRVKKATVLEFQNGMTLTVYPGGQQAAS